MEEQDKNALQELLDEIRKAIKETVTLKITTIVGDVAQGGADDPPTVANSKTMYTQIDLIQGDIVSMVDKAFLDEFAALREKHQAREDQAHAIVHKNIEALKELGEFVKELIDSADTE
jgi:uncharacterized protein (UPF0297 family)